MSDDVTVDRPEFGDYPAGTEVFSAKFDADDFLDPEFNDGREYPDGAIISIKRGKPIPQAWIIRHAGIDYDLRLKLYLKIFADDDAMMAIFDLNDEAYKEFFDAWDEDGGVTPGKSPKSTRPSKRKKRR